MEWLAVRFPTVKSSLYLTEKLARWPCASCLPYVYTTLEESLSITTGRCDLAIATHARKMHKNLFVVVHLKVLDND